MPIDPLSKTEIDSHSAFLTNQRIDKFFMAAGELTIAVLSSKPNPETAMEFFGVVMSIFTQTHYVYSEITNRPIKKEIDYCISKGNEINSSFQYIGNWTPEEVLNLNQCSLRALYLMVQGLQNLRYFLRLGKSEPKGIDAALEIFKLDIWQRRKSKEERESENDAAKV